jgi:hypothetical protein
VPHHTHQERRVPRPFPQRTRRLALLSVWATLQAIQLRRLIFKSFLTLGWAYIDGDPPMRFAQSGSAFSNGDTTVEWLGTLTLILRRNHPLLSLAGRVLSNVVYKPSDGYKRTSVFPPPYFSQHRLHHHNSSKFNLLLLDIYINYLFFILACPRLRSSLTALPTVPFTCFAHPRLTTIFALCFFLSSFGTFLR